MFVINVVVKPGVFVEVAGLVVITHQPLDRIRIGVVLRVDGGCCCWVEGVVEVVGSVARRCCQLAEIVRVVVGQRFFVF